MDIPELIQRLAIAIQVIGVGVAEAQYYLGQLGDLTAFIVETTVTAWREAAKLIDAFPRARL